jgi:leader peptidase (prepilin peptidase)/N-methyltransferase
MNEFFYAIIGIFGAILGSFASAVIPRIKAGQDFVTERSECPNCKHELGILDLFPVLSYVCLLGRCRYCKASIPPYHFLLELVMAGGFVLVATQLVDMNLIVQGDYAQIGTLVFLLSAMFVTVVFCAYDLLYMEIPDEFMIPFLTIALIILTASPFLPAGMF